MNATTMPRVSYDASHITQWSGLVALPQPGKCSRRIGLADAMVVVVIVTTKTQNTSNFS